ncbi:MAG: pyridoxamine 5'-phosphate oxidase, partial [Pseudomonadota bacterium]
MSQLTTGSDHAEPQDAGDFLSATEPFELFRAWYSDAEAHEINDPNAMAVATVDPHG